MRNRVPGTFDKLGVPLQPPQPRTQREIIFQGVSVDWIQMLSEDGDTLLGFQQVITDPFTNTTYRLPFNEKNRLDMLSVLAELGERNEIG